MMQAGTALAILGAGVMGEAVLAGVLRAGWARDRVVATDQRPERQRELRTTYGIEMLDNADATRTADTVFLVVKPQDVPGLLTEISPALTPGTLVVSLAAGVDTESIESRLPPGTPVIRVMPNTPAQVGEGMAVMSPGRHAQQSHLDRTAAILAATGQVRTVPEQYQDAVTAISGSGPAYVFLLAEAMTEAGVRLGLPPDIASALVVQTLVGSAKLLRDTGEQPAALRERVTSPGGTTAAAIAQLEDHDVRRAFYAAIGAARDRSRELADGARSAR